MHVIQQTLCSPLPPTYIATIFPSNISDQLSYNIFTIQNFTNAVNKYKPLKLSLFISFRQLVLWLKLSNLNIEKS